MGAFWTSAPTRAGLRRCNSKWSVALRLRLGCSFDGHGGLQCSLTNSSGDSACGRPLDAYLIHAEVCQRGFARQKAHEDCNAIAERHLRRCGAWTQREEAIPELFVLKEGKVEERFMDLTASFPAGKRWLLDVTVRSAFSEEVYPRSSRVAGLATKEAEKDKATRYKRSAWCLAWETRGRLGREGLQCLAGLAREAAELGRLQEGRARPRRLCVPALRMEVEAALAEAQATRVLAALGCKAVAAVGWPGARAATRA